MYSYEHFDILKIKMGEVTLKCLIFIRVRLFFWGKKSTLYVSYSTLYAYYTSFLWDFKFWKSINPIKSYADFPKNANFVSKMQLFVSKMPLSFSKKTIFLLKMINFSLKNDNFCHPVHLFRTVQLLTFWKSSTLYYYSNLYGY